MTKTRKSIAILRGGKDDHIRSIKSGANLIVSLSKYQDILDIIDVILDKDNIWFEKGIPSDPHKVFSKVDYYIDLTNNKDADYHNLSERLNVKNIFNSQKIHLFDRINVRRILNQINISMPRHIFIRDIKNIEQNLKEIWNKFHTPIVIKESNHHFNKKSILTHSFHEALREVKDILSSNGNVIIEEHCNGKYISVVAIPNYRGEDIYIPTPSEIINLDAKRSIIKDRFLIDKYLLDHNHEKKNLIYINDELKNKIKNIIQNIYNTLMIEDYVLIDLALIENKVSKNDNINDKKNIDYTVKILDIHANPHLFEGSRFDFILKNSGIDLGRIIIDKIEDLEEKEKIY